jgi:6,7-dimethyl-8-ribityllumazine synthase
MQVLEGHLDAQGLRFAIVVSRFNEALTSRLESGALDCLQRHGADDDQITIVRVPGAWEIPLVARELRMQPSAPVFP